ncbi:MAG: hypothetical protein ACI8QD_001611 [Cyclobacteriaceae bacterium]|jgi:hypothetical protein
MNSKFPYLLLLSTLIGCVPTAVKSPLTFQEVSLMIGNFDAENVGLVQMISRSPKTQFDDPIIRLGTSLTVNFDLLEDDFSYLNAKIFHCNADWTKSQLRDLEFLTDYNEYPIRDYDFSQTLYRSYVNYRFDLPKVTRSGNYILTVFNEDNNKILFNRRFVVYETLVQTSVQVSRSVDPRLRESHHQIDYELNYGTLNVTNPITDIETVIIQNQNWNKGIFDLEPIEIRMDQQILRYGSFENKNAIAAGTDFRIFDTRRIANKGFNVADQYVTEKGPQVILNTDKPRAGLSFAEPFQKDLNGLFMSSNDDFLETNFNTEYVNVNFTLDQRPISGDIYVTGRFNNWQKNRSNQLTYDEQKNQYFTSILMKQGYYNYNYHIVGTEVPDHYLEGSHFQTKNLYELLVYYREPGTVFDRVVGYEAF